MKQLAIIKDIKLGYYIEINSTACQFKTYISEDKYFEQVLLVEEIVNIINTYKINSLQDLNNAPCWLKGETFNSLCKI